MPNSSITIAAKCAADESILENIEKAGIKAVELYTNLNYLYNIKETILCCKKFPFRYAIHAPNEGFEINALAELVNEIKAEVVVFHNIYWEDEWENIVKSFNGINTLLCIENVNSVLESIKFMRRYGMGLCLDLEHLQIECAGYFEESFIPFLRKASHIHLTGYKYGSQSWHTHLHHSLNHSMNLLGLLMDAGYSGLIVSEAKVSYQTLSEFKLLNEFFQRWRDSNS